MDCSSVSDAGGQVPVYPRLENAGEYWAGRVVSAKRIGEHGEYYGYIVGIKRNPIKEVLITVKFEDDCKFDYHPKNLRLY